VLGELVWSPCGQYILEFSEGLYSNEEITLFEPNWFNVNNYLISAEVQHRHNQVGARELGKFPIKPGLGLDFKSQVSACHLVHVENSLLVCCAFQIVQMERMLTPQTEIGLWKLVFHRNASNLFVVEREDVFYCSSILNESRIRSTVKILSLKFSPNGKFATIITEKK